MALGATLLVGLVTGAMTLVAGSILAGTSVGRAMLLTGIFLPVLFVQDGLRYILHAERKSWWMAAADALWLLVVVLAWALLPAFSTIGALLVWFLGATLSASLAAVVADVRPVIGGAVAWFRSTSSLGPYYLIEYIIGSGGSQLVVVLLGAVAGLSAVGAVSATQAIFGPLNTVFTGTYLVVVPLVTRHLDRNRSGGAPIAVMISAATAVCCALWTAAVLAMPETWGRWLFGETWNTAGDLRLSFGVATLLMVCGTGPLLVMRGLRAARSTVRVRAVLLPVSFVLPLGLAAVDGAFGFVIGSAMTNLIATCAWWLVMRRTLDDPGASSRAHGVD